MRYRPASVVPGANRSLDDDEPVLSIRSMLEVDGITEIADRWKCRCEFIGCDLRSGAKGDQEKEKNYSMFHRMSTMPIYRKSYKFK